MRQSSRPRGTEQLPFGVLADRTVAAEAPLRRRMRLIGLVPSFSTLTLRRPAVPCLATAVGTTARSEQLLGAIADSRRGCHPGRHPLTAATRLSHRPSELTV